MYPLFRVHQHERSPSGTPVLCAERPAAGGRMHAAKEYSVGMSLQFPDPSLPEKRERHTPGGRLPEDGKHVIKDGKDQMAFLIESDENRELFRSLAQEINEIIANDEAGTIAG